MTGTFERRDNGNELPCDAGTSNAQQRLFADAYAPGFAAMHPRRAEVLGRDANLDARINNNYGQLGGHYGQLEREDNAIHRQEQRYAQANGGYITRGQQEQLNREENALSRQTFFDNHNNRFVDNHPRRSEVLGRQSHLDYLINKDRGHLGGHYGQLENQSRSIAHQEQRYAHMNGGYITRGQQGQLNHEENALRRQTFFDNHNNRFVDNHPRRSEVLGRQSHLDYLINKDRGHLGGNYGQLEHQARSIAHQEQRYAHQNGGYITRPEQRHLNMEENHLRRQIRQSHR